VGVQVVQAHPQSFDLLKIWENSLKIWTKNGAQRCLPSKNGANVCRNTDEYLFWRSHRNKLFMIFMGENLSTKVAQQLFGQVWRNSGKNPLHPQIFASSYTYATHYS